MFSSSYVCSRNYSTGFWKLNSSKLSSSSSFTIFSFLITLSKKINSLTLSLLASAFRRFINASRLSKAYWIDIGASIFIFAGKNSSKSFSLSSSFFISSLSLLESSFTYCLVIIVEVSPEKQLMLSSSYLRMTLPPSDSSSLRLIIVVVTSLFVSSKVLFSSCTIAIRFVLNENLRLY